MCDNYSRIVSEAIYKTKEGLKFLTPKQILQRFPIGPSQEQAGNTSENLQIIEIRQIIYSLYREKEITESI